MGSLVHQEMIPCWMRVVELLIGGGERRRRKREDVDCSCERLR